MRSRREVELYKILVNGMYGLTALNTMPFEYHASLNALFSSAQVVSSTTERPWSPQCLLHGDYRFFRSMIVILMPFVGVFLAVFWIVDYVRRCE